MQFHIKYLFYYKMCVLYKALRISIHKAVVFVATVVLLNTKMHALNRRVIAKERIEAWENNCECIVALSLLTYKASLSGLE